jgi:hypothetical protein
MFDRVDLINFVGMLKVIALVEVWFGSLALLR